MVVEIVTHGPEETRAVARKIAVTLAVGDVIGLSGELGAGKTCFVQGLASGLALHSDVVVSSPTYTIINEYAGDLTLFHLDLYRLADDDELELLGLRDMFGWGAMVVEWFERMPDSFPDDYVDIRIELDLDEQERRLLVIRGTGSRYDRLTRNLLVKQPDQ